MLIKKFGELSEEIIKEIREVELICQNHDKLNGSIFLDTSMNFYPEMKTLFLLYEDSRLVSFISTFVPTSEEAEISAYTLPEYRRRGYFRRLLGEAIEEVKKHSIPDIIFVCESLSNDGKETIRKLNAELDFTEYSLRYKTLSDDIGIQKVSQLKLCRAEQQNLEALISLSQEIFNDDYDAAKSMVAKAFKSDNRVQYMAVLDEKTVGMGSVTFENEEAVIFGFGISPQYQGKGYGKELLTLILKDLKNEGVDNITIEVDSSNKNAFKLYRGCGFEVEASFDYYRKSVI